jgi:hypothetical protein
VNALLGMRVVQSSLADSVVVKHELRLSDRRKRKRWSVHRVEVRRPGCLRMGDTFVMSPELYEKLNVETRRIVRDPYSDLVRKPWD